MIFVRVVDLFFSRGRKKANFMNVSGANDFIRARKAVLSLYFLVGAVFCFFVLFCLVCCVFIKLFLLEKIFSQKMLIMFTIL